MGVRRYWCPFGCGLSVRYVYNTFRTFERGYKCRRCLNFFSRGVIMNFKDGNVVPRRGVCLKHAYLYDGAVNVMSCVECDREKLIEDVEGGG